MSIVSQPSFSSPGPALATTAGRYSWLWLLAILAVGLTLRLLSLREPLQQDEFPPLYAIAERRIDTPDVTPAASDPLVPVGTWHEVQERSVLPYGIAHPMPLFHFLLYQTIQFLPVAEWSLRLPSLLAGLACIVAVFLLCRRPFGNETALVAALLVAVDPLQVRVSDLARPYALGNLACVLSFMAFFGVLRAESPLRAGLATLGYGLCLALIGYLLPIMLLVIVAHIGMLTYRIINPEPGRGWRTPFLWWFGGCALAVVLLLPLWNYFVEVVRFARDNRDYLLLFGELRIASVLLHNLTFVVALIVISLAGYVGRQVRQRDTGAESPGTAVAGLSAGVPPPDNPELVWLGRAWTFWPQMAALVLAFGLGQSLFLSGYLSYTSLGGAVLLAYWATREPARDQRLGVSLTVVLAVFLWGRLPPSWNAGAGIVLPARTLTMSQIDVLEEKNKTWLPNDVILVRSSALEADFLSYPLPEGTSRHVAGALLSPYTTLYVSQKRRPILLLSKSLFRSEKLHTAAGEKYDPTHRYNAALAKQLKLMTRDTQFWIASNDDPDRSEFFACFLPWLADAVDSDLLVARLRPEPERYFEVREGSAPTDYLDGLSNARPADFNHLVRVRRFRPPWAYRLGAVTELSPSSGPTGLIVMAWRLAQEHTPRLTRPPESDAEDGAASR